MRVAEVTVTKAFRFNSAVGNIPRSAGVGERLNLSVEEALKLREQGLVGDPEIQDAPENSIPTPAPDEFAAAMARLDEAEARLAKV